MDRSHPVLHDISVEAADDAADEHDQGNLIVVESDFFGEPFDWEWAVSVDLLVARPVRLFGGVEKRLRRIKLGHDAVNRIALRHYSFTSASGRRVRISKIEMAGRKRRNRNIAARNIPIVPKNV